MNVKRLPLRERPAYRVTYHARQANLIELLAALVGGGSQIEKAESLLEACAGDLHRLAAMPVEEMAGLTGIGRRTAVCVKSALQLGKRLALPGQEAVVIHSPEQVGRMLLLQMSGLDQEELWVLVLNTRNRVLKTEQVYRGSVNCTQVRVAELFRPAIRLNAPAIILAHNHPSGDPVPSPDDASLTRSAVQAGQLLDIDVLDHLVIGHSRFVSLKNRRLGFD